MRLLSLDVSSSCTGWAVVVGKQRPTVQSFGLIHSSSRDSVERIDVMTEGVEQLVTGLVFLDQVVMEWSSGKVHGRLGRVHGLAVLGQAQGAVRERLKALGREPVLVNENEWTAGKRKETRALELAMACPEYRDHAASDPGHDAADSIGLGLFWMATLRMREIRSDAQSAVAHR